MKVLRLLRNLLIGLAAIVFVALLCIGLVWLYFHPRVQVDRAVVYGQRQGKDLTLDVLRPSRPNGIGIVLMVSGGWKSQAGSLVERLQLLGLTEARWDEILNLNLKSAMLCSQAVAASMIERKSGAIINVVSIAGRNGGGLGAGAYAAAKGGLIAFAKSLAKELAPHGVRVNSVSPGVIDTPFHQRFSTPEMLRKFVEAIPLGRLGAPMECATVIAFLASPASSFVVGETVEVNGGHLML